MCCFSTQIDSKGQQSNSWLLCFSLVVSPMLVLSLQRTTIVFALFLQLHDLQERNIECLGMWHESQVEVKELRSRASRASLLCRPQSCGAFSVVTSPRSSVTDSVTSSAASLILPPTCSSNTKPQGQNSKWLPLSSSTPKMNQQVAYRAELILCSSPTYNSVFLNLALNLCF